MRFFSKGSDLLIYRVISIFLSINNSCNLCKQLFFTSTYVFHFSFLVFSFSQKDGRGTLCLQNRPASAARAKADRDVNVMMSNLQLFLLGRQQPSNQPAEKKSRCGGTPLSRGS